MRENALQRRELVHEFRRGVTAVLRRHARVSRAALDLDANSRGALAPDGERIRRVSGFHVEFDLVLLCQARDQLSGAGRTALFAVIEQQSDGRIVLEAEIVQNLQRGDRVDHAAFFIATPGPKPRSRSVLKGRPAAVPGPNTVSMCAMMRILPFPVP